MRVCRCGLQARFHYPPNILNHLPRAVAVFEGGDDPGFLPEASAELSMLPLRTFLRDHPHPAWSKCYNAESFAEQPKGILVG